MFRKIIPWLRNQVRADLGRKKMAHWVGRNWARFHYARHIEPTWLEMNRLTIAIPDLPVGFARFKVVQLSDFHGGKHIQDHYLRSAVDLANQEQPDLIALTGDYVHKGFRHIESTARILGKLSAPHGVFAVLGNHDFSVRNALGFRRHRHLHRAISSALADHGIQVLDNASHRLIRGDDQLFVAGVNDLWSRACDIDQALATLDPAIPRIVLAHNPATIELLAENRCDLMLSGHTHGGQVKLPWWGPVALGPKGRRFVAGLYQVGASQLYVNKGVGFGLRLRYNVRPEIASFTLTASSADSESR